MTEMSLLLLICVLSSLLVIFLLLTLHSSWMVQLPEPFGFIFTWFAALPLILFLAQSLTKAIVQDFLILKVVFFRRTIYIILYGIYILRQREN